MTARRVVLLGASNLTRGVSTVIETAAAYWGRPLEVFAALGHGRSYGAASSVMGRELPGIVQCGLWEDLRRQGAAATAALITDVGNDLLYGAPPEVIADWVQQCAERLVRHARGRLSPRCRWTTSKRSRLCGSLFFVRCCSPLAAWSTTR